MNRLLPIFLLLLVSAIVFAQNPAQNSFTVAIEGGRTFTPQALKTEAQLGNGYQLGTSVYAPLYRKGWDGTVKGGSFSFGIIAGAGYGAERGLAPDLAAAQATYKLNTGTLNIENGQNGGSYNKGYTGYAGLQLNVTLGKILLSPSLSGGYLSVTQEGYNQSTNLPLNGSSQRVVLTSSDKVKTTGFVLKPQFRISYPIAGGLNIYTSAALNAGPEIKTTQNFLTPAGGFNAKGNYEPQQLATGKMAMATEVKENAYKTFTVNAGISLSFGGSNKKTNSRQTQGATFGEKVNAGLHAAGAGMAKPGQPIGGIVVKGGKNPGGNSIAAITNGNGEFEFTVTEEGDYALSLTEGNPLYSNSANATSNPMYNPDAMAKPGNPIGGIIVKGGKNPGGSFKLMTTNDKGKIKLKGLKPGNYKFQVTAPEVKTKDKVKEKTSGGLKDTLKTQV